MAGPPEHKQRRLTGQGRSHPSSLLRRGILIMAKAPGPDAKTRLSPLLSGEERTALGQALLLDTLALAVGHSSRVGGGAEACKVFVACAPGVEAPAFAPLLEDWGRLNRLRPALLPQQRGDLGARIRSAAAVAFASGVEALLVLGTDSPDLTPDLLEQGFEALLGTADAPPMDLVFLPALDGGYCLAGMKRIEPSVLEEIPWSTPEVLWCSLFQARKAGRRFTVLESVWRDIDRPEDLRAFWLSCGGSLPVPPAPWNPFPEWLESGMQAPPGAQTRAWLTRFCQEHPERWSRI